MSTPSRLPASAPSTAGAAPFHWGLLESIAPSDRSWLAARLRPCRFPRGAVIYNEGDPCDAFYIVRSGRVRIFLPSDIGEEVTESIVGPGDWFGEVGAFHGGVRSSAAQAITPVEALSLARQVVMEFLEAHPLAALAVCAALAERVRTTRLHLAEVRLLPLPRLRARTLLRLSTSTRSPELRITQADLASLVGASRQRVNLTLAAWEHQGLLHRHQGSIVLACPEAIAKLV